MTFREYYNLAINAFSENNIGHLITEEKVEKLYKLSSLLVETNKYVNLTAITDEKEILLKHFVDSAAVSDLISVGANVIDIGCGAGFPSLPLAILRDDLNIVSLDSTGKKIDFVRSAAEALGLSNISAVCGRAEEYVSDNREKYDVSISRAVARLNVLAEISLPLVKVGGKFIAMKSNKGQEELDEADNGIKILGSKLETEKDDCLKLEDDEIARKTFVFKKIGKTPAIYPRKYAQIQKKPL